MLELTQVVVIPSRIPPHRVHGPAASTFHRFAMAALAVNDLKDVRVSDEELAADGPSYTARTLERIGARGFDRSQIFFISGADAFAEIESWYRYPAVLELAHFVVVSRPGAPVAMLAERVPRLRDRMKAAHAVQDVPPHPSILLVDAPTPDVSSTDIRRRVRAGETIQGLVPRGVESHILRHRLYAETPTADHLQ
ncbi:MAG: nicotinate (nicotinamide) nucleotide adenylyltransferase [Chloroflexota bacterium]|nr:nicotinate (nicotinamide) nucleotide adenylyltransferase [Chloroflexota bacterium]